MRSVRLLRFRKTARMCRSAQGGLDHTASIHGLNPLQCIQVIRNADYDEWEQ